MRTTLGRLLAFLILEIQILMLAPPVPLFAGDLFGMDAGVKGEVTVTPAEGGELNLGRVRLFVPPGAVREAVTLRIEPVPGIAPLGPGLRNLTGTGGGYRFLPAGIRFDKPVLVTLPCVAPGNPAAAIYFFHPVEQRWHALEKVKADPSAKTLTCQTTHFTDMVTAMLEAPEITGPHTLAPDAVSRLSAGDPSAGVPPLLFSGADPSGGLGFSLPLSLPGGRGEAFPRLALSYSSDLDSGWVGRGFDIGIPSLEIDTRFGVPLYDGTEKLLLSGAELVGLGGGEYALRREGRFAEIRRTGTQGTDTCYEVRDRDGSRSWYGTGFDGEEDAVECDPDGTRRSRWMLTRFMDRNGNTVDYSWFRDEGSLYPRRVSWSGHPETGRKGLYTLQFEWEARPDRRIDSRKGYPVSRGLRLQSITVRYDGLLIRSWFPEYTLDLFGKSRLLSFYERSPDGEEPWRYRFGWIEPPRFQDGIAGFLPTSAWKGRSGSLESVENLSGSGSLYLGVGWGFPASAGLSAGYENGVGSAVSMLADLDGDGRPDEISDPVGGSPTWRRNNGSGFDRRQDIPRFPDKLNRNITDNFQFSVSGNLGPLNASGGLGFGYSKTKSGLVDLNGDGYNEFVTAKGTGTHFWRYSPQGKEKVPYQSRQSWSDSLENNLSGAGQEGKASVNDMKAAYPCLDPVLEWYPYRSGTVSIKASAVKTEPGGDGVRLDLYQGDRVVAGKNLTDQESVFVVEQSLPVTVGEPLKFRCGVVEGIAGDTLRFGAELDYTGIRIHESMPLFKTGILETTAINGELSRIPYDRALIGVDQREAAEASVYYIKQPWRDLYLIHLPEEGSPEERALFARVLARRGVPVGYRNPADGKNYTVHTDGDRHYIDLYERVPLPETGELWHPEEAIPPRPGLTVPGKGVLCGVLRRSQGDLDYYWLDRRDGVLNVTVERAGVRTRTLEPVDGVFLDGTESFLFSMNPDRTVWRRIPAAVYPVEAPRELPEWIDSGVPEQWLFPVWTTQERNRFAALYAAEAGEDDLPGGYRLTGTPRAADLEMFRKTGWVSPYTPEGDLWLAEASIPDSWLARFGSIYGLAYPELTGWECRVYSDTLFEVELWDATVENSYLPVTGEDPAETGNPERGAGLVSEQEGILVERRIPLHRFNAARDFSLTDLSGTGTPDPEDWQSGAASEAPSGPKDPSADEQDALDAARDSLSGMIAPGGEYNWFYLFTGNGLERQPMMPLAAGNGEDVDPETGWKRNPWGRDLWYGGRTDIPEQDYGDDGAPVSLMVSHAARIERSASEDVLYLQPSRLCGDAVGKSPQENETLTNAGLSVLFRSYQQNWFGSGGVSGGGGGFTAGMSFVMSGSTQWTTRGLLDLNGDRYPDMVIFPESGGTPTVIPGNGQGFEPGRRWRGGFDYLKESSTDVTGFGGSMGLATGTRPATAIRGNGKVVNVRIPAPCWGVGASYADISSEEIIGIAELNGDGLPDHIRITSGGADVRLNNGNGFQRLPGGFGWPESRNDLSDTNGATVSFNIGGSYIVGLSAGVSASVSRTTRLFLDMNGDGLADSVVKQRSLPYLMVAFNDGDSFGEPVKWYTPDWEIDHDGFDIDLSVASAVEDILAEVFPGKKIPAGQTGISPGRLTGYDVAGTGDVLRATAELGCAIGLNVTIRIPLPLLLALYITPGGNVAFSRTSASLDMIDLDADGLPDHVCQGANEGFYRVKRNALGQAGYLESVTFPQGGSLEFGWTTLPSDTQIPFARTVLSSATLRDGFDDRPDQGDCHAVRELYTYEEGYYHRMERMNFGYRVVTRRIEGGLTRRMEYDNRQWHSAGLCTTEILYNTEGREISRTSYDYNHKPLSGGAVFSAVECETKQLTDPETGEGFCVRTHLSYDRFGNVIKVTADGNTETAGDETVTDLAWQYGTPEIPWMTTLAVGVTVRGADTEPRIRNFRYDSRGNRLLVRAPFSEGELQYSFEYDPLGNLIRATEPSGYAVEYQYDEKSGTFPVSASDSFGLVSTTRWNSFWGLPEEQVDPCGNRTRMVYDSHGRIEAVYFPGDRYPGGPALRFDYDRTGFPWSVRVENKTRPDPDDAEIFPVVTWADGLGQTIVNGTLCSVYDPETGTSADGWRYSGTLFRNRAGWPVQVGRPFFVNGSDPVYPRDQAPVHPAVLQYNPQGEVSTRVMPDGAVYRTASTVTVRGVVYENEDPEGRISRSLTDWRGVVLETTAGTGSEALTVKRDYDSLGQLRQVMRPEGSVVRLDYNELGLVVRRETPESGETLLRYDQAGRLSCFSDGSLLARNTGIRYRYDRNRLIEVDYPDSPDTRYSYGQAGAGENGAGRVTQIDDASGTTRLSYGLMGEVTHRQITLNRLTGNPLDAPLTFDFGYQYDYLGRLEALTWPDGEVLRYRYDRGGQAVRVTGEKWGEGFAYVEQMGYNAEGLVNFIKYGNGTETVYRYETWTLRLEGQETRLSNGELLQNLTMTHDRAGNVTVVEEHTPDRDLQTSYAYDPLGRLERADGVYDYHPRTTIPRHREYHQNFLYDTAGNLTGKNLLLTDTHADGDQREIRRDIRFTYDETRPHLPLSAGTLNLLYDESGRLVMESEPGSVTEEELPSTQAGQTYYDAETETWRLNHSAGWGNESAVVEDPEQLKRTQYRYDEEGRLTEAEVRGRTSRYRYNAAGLRTGKMADTQETLSPDPSYQVATRHDPATLSKHIFVAGRKVATRLSLDEEYPVPGFEQDNTFWYHADPLGSTRYLTDASGEEHEHRENLPFGEPWVEERQYPGLPPVSVLFTGQETDPETGLVCFPARYYSPTLSRWLTPDPAMDGNHWYGYCGNNPLKYVDPTGLKKNIVSDALAVIGIIAQKIFPSDKGKSGDYSPYIPQPQSSGSFAQPSEDAAKIRMNSYDPQSDLGDGEHTMANGSCKITGASQAASTENVTGERVPTTTVRDNYASSGNLSRQKTEELLEDYSGKEVTSDYWAKKLNLAKICEIANDNAAGHKTYVQGRATISLAGGGSSTHYVLLTGFKTIDIGYIEFSYIPASNNDQNTPRRYFLGKAPPGPNNYVINYIETYRIGE